MPLRNLLMLAAPYRLRLLTAWMLTLGSSLLVLALPWLAARLLGGILSPQPGDAQRLVALLLAVLAAIALANFAAALISGATANRLLADLRSRVYEHLQSLPIGWHENHRQGDTLALVTYEVARLSQFLTGTLINVPAQLLTAAGATLLMFRLDARLALVVPVLVLAFYFILKVIGRRLRGLAQAIQQAEADVVAVAEENLEMLPAIKAFTREQAEARRYRGHVGRAMNLALQENRIYAALDPLIGLIAAAAAVLLLFLAGRSTGAGDMTPTELFGFLFYAALLTRPVASLAHVYGQVQTARGTLARLQAVLEVAGEPGYACEGRLDAVAGAIAFRGVRFAYPGREPVLKGVDLEIRPGEVVALTGSNGSGKTTLIKLLLRNYELTAGEIAIDGRNIAMLDVQDLRGRIGLVSQHVLLFNGTVRANIAYGREGASDAEIEAAARLAQAWDFIGSLPQGLDTEIGDRGLRLSGGQRQRLALARALVKDPPILVLDEATSMFDFEGENAFVAACATALAGRTVILISHRPASLAMAGRIVRLEDGRAREVAPGELAMIGAAG